MYLTDAEFRTAVADVLRLAGRSAQLDVDQIAEADRCHRDAYERIRFKLVGRGASLQQVDAWSAGKSFERGIGLYIFFTTTSLGVPIDQQSIARLKELYLDPLEEVSEFGPGATFVGGVGSGAISDSGSVFGHDNYRRHVGPRHHRGGWGW